MLPEIPIPRALTPVTDLLEFVEAKGECLNQRNGPSFTNVTFSWALEENKAAMSLRLGSRQEAEADATLQCQEHRGRLLLLRLI